MSIASEASREDSQVTEHSCGGGMARSGRCYEPLEGRGSLHGHGSWTMKEIGREFPPP